MKKLIRTRKEFKALIERLGVKRSMPRKFPAIVVYTKVRAMYREFFTVDAIVYKSDFKE